MTRLWTYLIALLSFSYVMPGLFFLRPHILATASDCTNLKTPDSLSSHLSNVGLRVESFNKSLINSHKWLPFDCPLRLPFLGFVSFGEIGSSAPRPSSLDTLGCGRTFGMCPIKGMSLYKCGIGKYLDPSALWSLDTESEK